ncbi:MAG: hypothetical protein AAF828_08930, partial [Bacteroidota bacterium]
MTRWLLFWLALSLLSSLPGQSFAFQTPQVRLYQIPASLAAALLSNERSIHQLPALAAPLPQGTLRDTLPPGHYLSIRLEGENITWFYFSRHRHYVKVAPKRSAFRLKIFDESGIPVSNAQVFADGKPVKYRPKDQVYQRRDWQVDLLSVRTDTDTLFFDVQETIRTSRLAHNARHLT